MRRLDEILKQIGWSSATAPTSPASEGAPTDASAGLAEAEEEICEYCGGAGLVRKAVSLGHPDFGKAFPCRCTLNESEEGRLARLQRYSNLRFHLRLTFDNLMAHGRSGDIRNQERFAAAVAAAREFAEEPSGWLLFSGPSGCGKTHLAAAIANRCIEKGVLTLFMGVSDLLDHLRAAYRPDAETPYDDLFEQLRSVPVLVLDDLGAHTATPWAREKLFQLVNHRFTAQMPTVFTTTLDVDRLDEGLQTRLGDASLSRVFVLEEPGSDRMRKVDSLDLPLLRTMTFKSFEPAQLTADREEIQLIQNAYRQALKFAEDPRDWLVLAGSPGRGKTRLAAAIGNYCRQAGKPVLFVIVPDLLDHLRSTFDPQNPAAYDDAFEAVRTVPLLILDDLGAHTSTPWAEEKLFQLINYRYNSCLPTVITTSLSFKEFDRKLASRLTDPQVSTILPMGKFDLWGKEQERQTGFPPGGRRGRPPRKM